MVINKKIDNNNYINNDKNTLDNISTKYIFIIKNVKKIKKIEQLNYFINKNQFTQVKKIINIKNNAIKEVFYNNKNLFSKQVCNSVINNKLPIHNNYTAFSSSDEKINFTLYSKTDSNIYQTKIQDEVNNFYNKNNINSQNYQKNNVNDKSYKIELKQFFEKTPISILQKGPFQIFKSKIITETRLQGKYFEKTIFFYFLYRNLDIQQRKIYQTFWKILINTELENKLSLTLPLTATIKNSLNNTFLEPDSKESTYKLNINSHNLPLTSYKEGIINTSKSIKNPIFVKLKTMGKNSTNTFILNPTKNILKNNFFYNTPYLIWLDSMINQFIQRFSSNKPIKNIEIEKIIFQLALNMGKKWTEMTMSQKSEWIKKIKNNYKNDKKSNKEALANQLNTSSFNSNNKLNIN